MKHLEESKLSKIIFKKGDFELHLEKEVIGAASIRHTRHLPPEPMSEPVFHTDTKSSARVDQPGSYVISPMVGTFYQTPAPDQPSFVKVGDRVTEDTVVCIIEAMKVMNEVKAGVAGIVAEVMANNAQPVEFGTRLLRIT